MIKVGIAEDDFRVAMIHEAFLLKIDEVCVAGKALNGSETIQLLKTKQIDLLLLDIYMPDQHGVDLIKMIRTEHPSVDIMIISASSDKKIVETTVRHGVIDYMIKPITFDRFKQTIEQYKQTRKLLETPGELTQQIVDQYLGSSAKLDTPKPDETPKGIDPLTLKKVESILINYHEGVTADEVGEQMGASRTTARRYLEYLISIGAGKAELSYGIVGRPVRKYFGR